MKTSNHNTHHTNHSPLPGEGLGVRPLGWVIVLLLFTLPAFGQQVDSLSVDTIDTRVIDETVSPELRIVGLMTMLTPDRTDGMAELRTLLDSRTPVRAASLTTRRGVVVHGDALHAATRLRRPVASAIGRLHAMGSTIDGISISDAGWWAITHDGNSVEGELPASLEASLDSLSALGQHILSVSIANGGDYAYATTAAHGASDYHFALALDEAARLLGEPTSVCQTDCALLAVCPHGVYVLGVPESVVRTIAQRPQLPQSVTFTDLGTCIVIYPDGTNTYYF